LGADASEGRHKGPLNIVPSAGQIPRDCMNSMLALYKRAVVVAGSNRFALCAIGFLNLQITKVTWREFAYAIGQRRCSMQPILVQ
jgi:hypothetical protein